MQDFRRHTLGWICVPWALALLVSGCDDATPSRDTAPEDSAVVADSADFDAALMPDAAVMEWDAAPLEQDAEVDADLRDAATAPNQGAEVQTYLGTPGTPVGLANKLTCTVWDENGEPVDAETAFEVRPSEGWRVEIADDAAGQISLIGETAGVYSVQCLAPNIGLRDESPQRWDVYAGPAAVTRVRLDRPLMTAGESVHATCSAFDEYGNEVSSDDARLEVLPAGAGVTIDGRDISMTTAGRHAVRCLLGNATPEEARLDVLPALPSRLVATVSPALPVHLPGAIIAYDARVLDEYGNEIRTVSLDWTSNPEGESFGEGRYRLDEEGRYTLTVTVTSPTLNDVELTASAEVLVDAGGPSISCTGPELGAMVGAGAVNLTGRIRDTAGLGAVTVDGRQVDVNANGDFSTNVQPSWGLNVHQVVARDAVGNSNSVFCAYFSSDRYIGETADIDDAILLHMAQGAVDDGGAADPIRSLADLLRKVLASDGLVDAIDGQLSASNPLLANDCRVRDPIFGACLTRAGATYSSMSVGGPNTVSMNLIDGGIQARVVIRDLVLRGNITGTFSRSATFRVNHVTADLSFRVRLVNGRPQVTYWRENALVVGDMSASFGGGLGFVFDLIFSAFEGTVRGEVTSAMRTFMRAEVDGLLEGVLGGLDLADLGLEFVVPGIGDSPATPLSMQVDFSRIDVNPNRMRIGISTSVNGPTRQAAASEGVPLPPGNATIEQNINGTIGAAVYLGLLNQLLHRLWRAGLFTIDDAASVAGGLGDGVELSLRVLTPPAVKGTGNGAEVEIHLGPAVGELVYPGFFDEPLVIRMAVIAHAGVELNGEEINFGGADGIVIDQLHLMIEGVTMSAQARAAVERDLRRIIQNVINSALAGALPTLPIPDFALPDSMSEFGIRRGTRLGLRNPSFEGTGSHFLVDGVFSE